MKAERAIEERILTNGTTVSRTAWISGEQVFDLEGQEAMLRMLSCLALRIDRLMLS